MIGKTLRVYVRGNSYQLFQPRLLFPKLPTSLLHSLFPHPPEKKPNVKRSTPHKLISVENKRGDDLLTQTTQIFISARTTTVRHENISGLSHRWLGKWALSVLGTCLPAVWRNAF